MPSMDIADWQKGLKARREQSKTHKLILRSLRLFPKPTIAS